MKDIAAQRGVTDITYEVDGTHTEPLNQCFMLEPMKFFSTILQINLESTCIRDCVIVHNKM